MKADCFAIAQPTTLTGYPVEGSLEHANKFAVFAPLRQELSYLKGAVVGVFYNCLFTSLVAETFSIVLCVTMRLLTIFIYNTIFIIDKVNTGCIDNTKIK